MEKKYEILKDQSITLNGHTLYRIKLLKQISNMSPGTLGGFIESEDNLSQEGDCWVAEEAAVYGHSKVMENAWVEGSARISGFSIIRGKCFIAGSPVIINSKIKGNSTVRGRAVIKDSLLHNHASVSDKAELYYVRVYGLSTVRDFATVTNTDIEGDACISGRVCIKKDLDYTVIKNFWSSGRIITYTRPNRMWRTGCFLGTGEELIKKAYNDSKEKGEQFKLLVEYVEKAYALKEGKGKEPLLSKLLRFLKIV
jgi:carbonic anhydrase/acetyltransferase-like protein (isoleucine patch superfamily)